MEWSWDDAVRGDGERGECSVEESSACVDEMLQDGKDVRKGSRVASEGSEGGLRQRAEVVIIILPSIHEQCCELLCLLVIQIGDSQLRQPVAASLPPPAAATEHTGQTRSERGQ